MGLFGKKKKEEETKETEKLPKPVFPEMTNLKEAIKPPEFSGLPPLPKERKFEQISDTKQYISPPITEEISKPSIRELKEPIFIKIGHFKEALNNFELIKKKLRETAVLLERVKETRKREEEELGEWSRELEIIKEKIGEIDRKLFGRIEF